jgi:hypothetical protein
MRFLLVHDLQPRPCGGHVSVRIHLRRREPPPQPGVDHAATGHPRAGHGMLDPEAPGGTFTHWLAYGIPPGTSGLAVMPTAVATAVHALRAGLRITITSCSLHWAPGWVWRTGDQVRRGVTHRGRVLTESELVTTYQRA